MEYLDYVKPELLVVALVLYFIGLWIKESEGIKDKYIPILLGIFGVLICSVWVLATATLSGVQEIASAAFSAITQGILVAGLSNYINQIFKQSEKDE